MGVKKEDTSVCLLHVLDTSLVCGGVIGHPDNKKFCVSHPNLCEFQTTHAGKKFPLVNDCLYVMSPKKGGLHATVSPSLPVSLLPRNTELSDLLNDVSPVEMWHVFFDECRALEASSGANELGLDKSEEERDREERDRPSLYKLEKANDFKTPRKVRVFEYEPFRNLSYFKLEDVEPFDSDDIEPAEANEEGMQKAVRHVLEGWGKVSANFTALSQWTTDNAVNQSETTITVGRQLKEIIKFMNDVGAKTRLLRARMDQRDNEEGQSSLWKTIGELKDDLKAVEVSVAKTVTLVKTHEKDSKKMAVNMKTMYDHYKNHLVDSNKRLVTLEQDVSTRVNSAQSQAQDGFFTFDRPGAGGGSQAFGDEIRKLREEINEMKRQAASTAAAPSSNSMPSGNPMFPATSGAEILSRLKAVETRDTTAESCSIGSTTFSTEAAVSAYIKANTVPSCAMYWDLFSVMVCMGSQGVTGKERSDEIYSAERGRTGSALEGRLVASMTHKRPLCLYGEESKLARLDQGFAMCKTYEHWIGSGTGVSYREELGNQINDYTDGILGQSGDGDTSASLMAKLLISQVLMQWNAIVGFIDSFYLDLVAKCKFDSAKAWKLVAVCVASIFKATQPYRAKVILLEDSTKLAQKAAFMWATFQTHRVIQSFISVKFQSHPFIVTEISLFMVRERVDSKEVEALATKCQKAEETSSKASAEVKRLLESHNDLKRKHDALHAEFKLVKAKVK
jgi:hypothetical protein